MSLTQTDLQEIREVVRSVVGTALKPLESNIHTLSGKIEALENDIKDIYQMLRTFKVARFQTEGFGSVHSKKSYSR